MPLLRHLFIWVHLLFILAAAEDSLLLRGRLLDEQFKGKTGVTGELLETGDTFPVVYGEPFTVSLTDDAAWNICIRSDTLEQCYLITRDDTSDSIITGTLQNDNAFEVFTRFVENEPLKAVATDTLAQDPVMPDTTEDNRVAEIVTQLRPVVIQVRKRPRRRIGQSTVSAKAIERQPGLAEADVIKAIQALPGVVASSDFSSKIYVRGGGSDQNLFLFDNGVVYSPVHFFGLFSTFLVDGIESVDFYKGGFSPVYGNRLSSVVDIKSRKGGKEDNDTLQFGGSAQITTFATTASVEASKGRLQLNASARATYIKEMLAFLRDVGATDVDIDYRFYDLQGNLSLRLTDNQLLTISGYAGKDNLLFNPLEVFWGNVVVPVNHYWEFSDNLAFTTTMSYTYFDQLFGIENLQTLLNYLKTYNLKSVGVYSGIENHLLTCGVQSQYFNIMFGNKVEFLDFDYVEKKKFMLHSVLAEDKYTLGDFDIAAGVRCSYYPMLTSFYVEPRLSVAYSFTPDKRVEGHVGYYRQFINSIGFGDMEPLNENYYPASKEPTQTIGPAASLLFSVGFVHNNLFDSYDFSWEAYYKTLDNLFILDAESKPDSIRNDLNSTIGDFFVVGEGYSLGTEVSLRKKNGVFTGGISYAFGFSVQKDLERVYHATWEIPHSLKVDGGISWREPRERAVWKSRRFYLRSSLQIKYTSGLPFTEVTGHLPTHFLDQGAGEPQGPAPILVNNTATPLGGRNKSRYPTYGRTDLKLVDWGREDAWSFNWTILNIMNRENIFRYFYDTSQQPPERITIPQFPFFPILLSYKRYF